MTLQIDGLDLDHDAARRLADSPAGRALTSAVQAFAAALPLDALRKHHDELREIIERHERAEEEAARRAEPQPQPGKVRLEISPASDPGTHGFILETSSDLVIAAIEGDPGAAWNITVRGL
ncbi:hypothetical protein E8L99_16590 [Phreatobacter aquaticus]|uniref:Uncharacterized protein n=1 Tax=Phreatobacter aquaticus TaxID=2570229 RepID=A0A4D7QHK7_9HYPH|nr:hemerythrin domain-containing protein [Phreatobacter aquaticus]QCK87260.1 hypothetical protein E8L99_16590 [Phreatobacter aquaticus]